MAHLRGRYKPSCSSPTSCCLVHILLLFFLVPRSMFWTALYEARACIPTICLKYLVICLANTLLATGWLLLVRALFTSSLAIDLTRITQSILSIVVELLPTVTEVPPTLPRLPGPPPPSSSPVPTSRTRSSPRVRTTSPPAHAAKSVVRRASGGPAAVQHVKFTSSHVNAPATTPVPSAPLITRSRTPPALVIREERISAGPSSPGPSSPPLVQSDSDHSEHNGHPERGRKLNLFARRFNQGSPNRTRHQTPPNSGQSSPARSPERPDKPSQHGGKSTLGLVSNYLIAYLSVKLCLKSKSSNEALPKSPVPRTNPYQAPYFFPSPLSPDAADYVHLVRSERRPSEQSPSRPRPPRSTSLGTTSPSVEPRPPKRSMTDKGGKGPRRSWHIPFHRDDDASLKRPSSWDSEAHTLLSSGSGSTEGSISSPVTSPSSRGVRYVDRLNILHGHSRSTRAPRQLTLSPLQSEVALDHFAFPSQPTVPAPETPKGKKHWPFRFRHHRSLSDTSNASQLEHVSSSSEAGKRSKSRLRKIS